MGRERWGQHPGGELRGPLASWRRTARKPAHAHKYNSGAANTESNSSLSVNLPVKRFNVLEVRPLGGRGRVVAPCLTPESSVERDRD